MAYDPTLDGAVLFWLGNQVDTPGTYWQGAVGSSDLADTLADPIKNINTSLSQTWNCYANTDANRPQLGALGSVAFDAFGGQTTALKIASSADDFNAIHVNGTFEGKLRFFVPTGYGGKSRPFADNTNVSTTTRGFYWGTIANGSNSQLRFYLTNGSATILNLITEELITENEWHVARVHLEPSGPCWLQLDDGARKYNRLSGALGSGNATTDLYLGNRLSAGTQFIGSLRDFIGLTAWSDAREALWDAENPAGSINGSPEIRVGDFHLNFSRTRGYAPEQIWWKDWRVSPMSSSNSEDGAGCVYNDSVTAPDGWNGVIHGNETVTSKVISVDGVESTLVDGTTYEADSSVTFTRETTLGTAFYQIHRFTVSGNFTRDYVHLTRRNDGNAINPLYMVRAPRELDYNDYMTFDVDGVELEDDAVAALDVTCAEGTVAIAQWSPDAGQMILSVLTKGRSLDYECIIVCDTYNRRIYWRVYDASSIGELPEGGTLEMEVYSRHYEATAGTWKALAQSEVLKILKPRPVTPKTGINMRLGYRHTGE